MHTALSASIPLHLRAFTSLICLTILSAVTPTYAGVVTNWGFTPAGHHIGDSITIHSVGSAYPSPNSPTTRYSISGVNPTWVGYRLSRPNGSIVISETNSSNGMSAGSGGASIPPSYNATLDMVGTWTLTLYNIPNLSFGSHGPVSGQDIQDQVSFVVAANAYNISTSSSPSNGGTTGGAGTVTAGNTVAVTATAATGGWTFKRWTESGVVQSTNGAGATSSTYSFTASANRTLVAEFNPPVFWTLTPSVTGSGTISPNTPTSYLAGMVVTVSSSPGTGYYLSSWGGTANPGGAPGSFTVTMNSNQTIVANFSANNYTVGTSVTGNGSVSGGGTYGYNSTATMIANSGTGYYFAGWSGPISGLTNPQGFTVTGNTTVTANFLPIGYTVSTSTTGSGSVSGGGAYNYGTTDTLTANPGTGYYFAGWSGALAGTTNPQNLFVDGNKSVTANFSPNTYMVTGTPTGSGSISGAGSYTYGQTATLTANPGTGYSFSGWSGGLVGATNPQNLLVDGNKAVTATFTVNSYTVTTGSSGAGTGSVSGGGSYTYGQNATCTATPSTGSTFAGWSGAATGTTNPVSIAITGNQALTATFTLNNCTLTTTTTGSGSGSVTPGASSAYGTTQRITATPSTGSAFTGWSGAATGATNPVTITIDSNKTLAANFTINTYPLTTTITGAGNGAVSGAGTYNYGSAATSTASPSPGSTFAGWSNAATGMTPNPVSISMTSAKTLTAAFTLNNYTLTTNASGTGTVTTGGIYTYGSVQSINATPGTGQQFTGWSGAATGTTNPVSITVDSNKTLTATFAPLNYTLTTKTAGSGGGSVTPGGTYAYGTTHAITATPATGQAFVAWSGAATGAVNPVTITSDADKTLTANFAPINYTLSTTVTPAAGGTIAGSGVFPNGSIAALTATPAPGYTFAGFTGGVISSTNPSSLTVNGDATVTAHFNLIVYSLTTTTTGSGAGSVSGGASYAYGTQATATATPATGSNFTGWSNAATGTTNPAVVSMTADKLLTAAFSLKAYTVSTNVVGVGTLTGGGSYYYGQSAPMTAAAGTGYTFAGWSGAISGVTNPQSVLVDSDKSVSATFSANAYTLGITVVGSGSATGAGNYTYGQTATLSATPGTGYLFSGFSGAVTSSTTPATLLIDGNKSATATFAHQIYTLTTNVSGSGLITAGGTYNAPDPIITAVTLVATPAGSTRFTGYTGSITGTIATINSDGTASLYVPMTIDRAVVANFASRLSQFITFAPMGAHSVSETFTDLTATATSGLPVAFTVVSGPGTLSGSRLTFTGVGTIVVQASQGGNYTYFAAAPVQLNASIAATPVTTLKEDGGPSKINNGEKEAGNFRPGT